MTARKSRPVVSRRSHHWYRKLLLVLGGIAALVGLDQYVGDYQSRELARRKALKADLDRLSFQALRTGIDEITFDGSAYRMRFRLQNATSDPFFVLVPAIDGFVQVGSRWEPFPVKMAQQDLHEGMVIELASERVFTEIADIEGEQYTEPMPGYRHLKVTLDAFVSPEANPREEIGEHKEDFFLFLRDAERDGVSENKQAGFRPAFIPLRGWTLLPK
jgi:hypothetical protein